MGLLAFPNLRQLNQQALVKVIKLLHKLLRTRAETLSKIHLFKNCTMHYYHWPLSRCSRHPASNERIRKMCWGLPYLMSTHRSHVRRTEMMFYELVKGWDQYFYTQDVSVVQGICVVKSNTGGFLRKCHFHSPGWAQKKLGDIFSGKIKK